MSRAMMGSIADLMSGRGALGSAPPPAQPQTQPSTQPPAADKANALMQPCVTLDHSRFPHLVDMVVKQCDLPTMLALRATSHKFLDMVDDYLFGHVLFALRHFPPATGAVLDTAVTVLQPFPPYARLPFLPWDQDGTHGVNGFDATDPDSYPYPPRSFRKSSRYAQLARVRILDYHPIRGKQAVKIGELLTSVQVIRRRRPLSSAIRSSTAVDYVNLTSPSCHRSGHVPWAVFAASFRTPRCVLHVSFDPSHPYLSESLIYADLREVKELVVVFSPQRIAPQPGMTIGPSVYENTPRLGMLLGLLRSVGYTMWELREDSSVHLVGIESMWPGYLGVDDDELEGEALVERVRKDWIAATIQWAMNLKGIPFDSKFRQELERRAEASTQFTTMEEWRATAPAVEQEVCPRLPGVDEDARDLKEWADGSGLVNTNWEHHDDNADFLPHCPWSDVVSQEALQWIEEHR